MHLHNRDIEIISAPSILGLKPTGVEMLSESLLAAGLAERLHVTHPVIHVETLNSRYREQRDLSTGCLNAEALREFSITLGQTVSNTNTKKRFPLVLGGDCSILIGIMCALKAIGPHGLVFMDAHADFYSPEKSLTGQVADMDLAVVTGRGPDVLTNINGLQPYVKEENVIHLGQRDWAETVKYRSPDIRKTRITCMSLEDVRINGLHAAYDEVLHSIRKSEVEEYWIHFDTDVLSDEINPAVDYRLPGGLLFEEAEYLMGKMMKTGIVAGISVTIFNPVLDEGGLIAKNIAESLGRAFNFIRH